MTPSTKWVQAESTHLQFKQQALIPHPEAQTTRLQKPAAKVSRVSGEPQLVPSQPNVFKVSKVPKVIVGIGTSGEKFFLTWSKLLIGGCLALLPLGGILIGVQSSYISAVCQTLDNCINDQRAELYQQSVRQATAAGTLSEMAKSLPDLKLARKQLSAAVAQLSSLANDRELSLVVQQKLSLYRSHLDNLEARLEKESKATELLSRARAEAQKASELTTIAQKSQDYGAARLQWAKALATLQAIRPSTFAQNQVTARSQEYSDRLETLDLRIAALNPQPIAQTPANPFQPLVGEPLTEPSVALRPSPQLSQVSPPEQIAYAPRTAPRAATPRAISTRSPQRVTPQAIALAERIQRRAAPARSTSAQATVPRSTVPRSTVPPASSLIRQPPQVSDRPTAIASPLPTQLVASALPSTNSSPVTNPSPAIAQPALSQQTLNNVSIQIDDAKVSPDGTVAANLVVENHSDRTFGFVPLFAEVEDANGNIVRSRVHFTNTDDGIAEPGEILHGQVHMFNRQWNPSGSQNLALVIQEGTTGSRNFRLTF